MSKGKVGNMLWIYESEKKDEKTINGIFLNLFSPHGNGL